MSIKSIEVMTIAQICFVAVSSQREALGEEVEGGTWQEVDPEQQHEIINYVTKVLTGQATPDTPDGRMIARICHQFADPKKTLKYA